MLAWSYISFNGTVCYILILYITVTIFQLFGMILVHPEFKVIILTSIRTTFRKNLYSFENNPSQSSTGNSQTLHITKIYLLFRHLGFKSKVIFEMIDVNLNSAYTADSISQILQFRIGRFPTRSAEFEICCQFMSMPFILNCVTIGFDHTDESVFRHQSVLPCPD